MVEFIDANEREEHLATLRRDYPTVDWDSGEWILEDVAQWNGFEESGLTYFISHIQNNRATAYYIIETGYNVSCGEYADAFADKEPIGYDFWFQYKRDMEDL